uniref:Uncharacterized protein n=1 Tax=Rousettus aegyptiacus TaxID=9407 RepID=A0A7J8C2U1_ROUAE|nr:hypothetical protein HJG63_009447 [Rousettus aegyptiacus]
MQERGKGPSYISLCIWLSRPRGSTQGLSGLILNPPQMHQNTQPYASRRSPCPRRGRPWLHRHLCSSKLLTQGVGTWLLNLVLVYSSTVVLFSLFQLPFFKHYPQRTGARNRGGIQGPDSSIHASVARETCCGPLCGARSMPRSLQL